MKRHYRQVGMFVVLLLCTSVLIGCAGKEIAKKGENKAVTAMEPEESRAISPSFIGGKDVMPITGYYGPYPSYVSRDGDVFPNYISEEFMEAFADAGINLIVYSSLTYSSNAELVEQYLDMGEKYGIGIFVNDSNVLNYAGDDTVTASKVGEEIANYSDYPAFCGMYVVDEPTAPYYQAGDGTKFISKYVELAKILQNDLDILCYMNLLPVWDIDKKQEAYEQYVEEFCKTIKPKVLMWDKYPFSSSDGLDVYFYNMSLIREHAEEGNIPFWAFIQAGAQWNDENRYFDSELPYYPNQSQFNWNVNTSLAFGAQGIQYFPLIQPANFAYALTNEWDFQRNALIGAIGNKNQWYYYAQSINKHIAAIDEVLMNSVNKGIIVNGEQAKKDTDLTNCVIESGKFQELMSVSGDAMVGCFNYNGQTALYVVNYDMENPQLITLNLNKAHNIQLVQDAETSYVNSQNLQLNMAAGEGVLVVIN